MGKFISPFPLFPPVQIRCLKLCQLFQFLHALLDVGAFGFRCGVQAKTFAAERRGDAAVNHRAADVRVNRTFGLNATTKTKRADIEKRVKELEKLTKF